MVEAVIGATCFLTMLYGATWMGGLIVFAPLHEKTLLFQVENRFRIADIVALGILLQLSIGAVLAIKIEMTGMPRIFYSIVLLLTVSLWWVSGLRMLSRAGVTYSVHRWLFLTFALPAGYVSLLSVLGCIVLCPIGAEMMAIREARFAATWWIGLFLFCMPGIGVAVAIFCHRICRGMAFRARDERAERDGISFDAEPQEAEEGWVPSYLASRNRQTHEDTGDEMWLDEPVVNATVTAKPEEVDEILQDPNALSNSNQPENPDEPNRNEPTD